LAAAGLDNEANICAEESGWRCNNNNFFAAEDDQFEFSEPMVSDPVSNKGPFTGLPGSKKSKRPNLAISNFKKGQIQKNEKRPNKGQISFKKFVRQPWPFK
jgi:hypothetical protein